jgi:hypothetical protein
VSTWVEQTYGTQIHSQDELCAAVSAALGITFEGRESSYHCGNYWNCRVDNTEMIIQDNCVDPYSDDGDLWAPEFADHPVLLMISSPAPNPFAERILSIPGLTLLETRE